jgi:hypothetical protein
MQDFICIVGLDEPEYSVIRERVAPPVVAHETLPRIKVDDGQLWVESDRSPHFVPVSKVIFHSIYETIWTSYGAGSMGGPRLPKCPRHDGLPPEAALPRPRAGLYALWRTTTVTLRRATV